MVTPSLTSACISNGIGWQTECDDHFTKMTCTKVSDIEIDGHNKNMVIGMNSDYQECPKNHVLVGFCFSGLYFYPSGLSCDGNEAGIVCAPLKFNECVNTNDVLDNDIDLEYRLTSNGIHIADKDSYSFWKAENYQNGVCVLGDVLAHGNEWTDNMHILVRGLSDTAVKPPKNVQKAKHQPFSDLELFDLEPESGYHCLGQIVEKKGQTEVSHKRDYCCVRKDLTVAAELKTDNGYVFPVRDRADTQGLVGGHFYYSNVWGRRAFGSVMRLLRVDHVNVRASFDMRGPKGRPIRINEARADLIAEVDGKFSIWRADILAEKVHRAGDIVTKSYEKPNFHFLLNPLDDRALMEPMSWTALKLHSWNNWLFKHNVTFWRPDCPTNYVAVGDVLTLNDAKNQTVKPETTDASCIHKDYITQDQREMQHLRTFEADILLFDLEKYVPAKVMKGKNWLRHESVQYVAEKPVLHSRVIEIKYYYESKEIDPSKIEGMRKASVINRSYFPQCATRSYEYATGTSHSHSTANEIELGGHVSMDVPKIKGLGGNVAGEVTFGIDWENADEEGESESSSIDATLEMPEESQLSVNILRRKYKQNIPYSALIEKTYFDGNKAFQVAKGVYEGVSTSEIIVDYSKIKFLNGESRYEDSTGLVFKYGDNEKTWFNLGSDDLYKKPHVKQPV